MDWRAVIFFGGLFSLTATLTRANAARSFQGTDVQRGLCQDPLLKITPDFDPDLVLIPEVRMVNYKGVTFRLSKIQFKFLRLIVEAPDQLISTDDLIISLWDGNEGESAANHIRKITNHVRAKFKRIDPSFNKLKTQIRSGLYWERPQDERFTVGRIGVGRVLNEGFADGVRIDLNPIERDLLAALLRRKLVSPSTIGARKSSFKTNAYTLNQKFKAILGVKVARTGPHGSGSFTFNKDLR